MERTLNTIIIDFLDGPLTGGRLHERRSRRPRYRGVERLEKPNADCFAPLASSVSASSRSGLAGHVIFIESYQVCIGSHVVRSVPRRSWDQHAEACRQPMRAAWCFKAGYPTRRTQLSFRLSAWPSVACSSMAEEPYRRSRMRPVPDACPRGQARVPACPFHAVTSGQGSCVMVGGCTASLGMR